MRTGGKNILWLCAHILHQLRHQKFYTYQSYNRSREVPKPATANENYLSTHIVLSPLRLQWAQLIIN